MAKKSGTAIRDFFISLGFDASDVEKGFKQIEREFSKLQKTLNGSMSANIKVQNQRAKADAKSVKATDSKIVAERKLFNLEKSRARLKERIAYIEARSKAEGTYVKDYYKDQKNAARSKNKERIDLEYDKLGKDFKFYKNLEEGDARTAKSIAANEKSAQQDLAAFKQKTLKENAKALQQFKKQSIADAKEVERAAIQAEKAKQQAQAATQKAKKAMWRADKAEGLRVKARLANQKKAEQENIKLGEKQYELRKKQARANIRARRSSSASGSSLEEKRWLAKEKVNRLSSDTAYSLQRQRGANPRLAATDESVEYNRKLMEVSNMASTAKTTADFRRLNNEISNLHQNKTRLINKNKELQNSFRATGFTARALQDSLRNLARSYVSVFAIIGGSGMAASTGQDLVSLRTSLLAATGSAEEAGKAFEFVKSTSLGMGTDLQAATKGFSRISIAAKNAGLSTEDAKNIFLSAAEASTAFSLSTDDTAGVLRAFDQILSKGNVQAEELRGQLGDRLTGAFYIAAEAMGYTTQELNKMMEQGKLGSKEFMIPFTKQLREVVREGGAFEAGLKTSGTAMRRFGTSFKLNILNSFDAGFEGGLASFFNSLSDTMKSSAPLFQIIGKIFGGLATVLGVIIFTVKELTRPFTIFFRNLIVGTDEANKKVSLLRRLFAGLAWLILTPIVYLGRFNDWLEEISKTSSVIGTTFAGISSLISASIPAGLSYLALKMFGITSRLSKFVSGWGMLKGVFNLLANHPFIRTLMLIYGAAEAAHALTQSDDFGSEKSRLLTEYGKDGAISWDEKVLANAMAFQHSGFSWVREQVGGIADFFRDTPASSKTYTITNNITSTNADPAEVAKEVVRAQSQAEYQASMR